jgi:hypothetical protein
MKGVPRAPVIDDSDLIGPSQGPQSRHGRISAPAGRPAEGTAHPDGVSRCYPEASRSRAPARLGWPSAAWIVQVTNFVGPMKGLREAISPT